MEVIKGNNRSIHMHKCCECGTIYSPTSVVCPKCKSRLYAHTYVNSKITDEVIKLNEMSGTEFENFCVLLLSKLKFSNIEKTKNTGDFGVDILANKNNKKYAFQCKRYEKPVSNSAVQEIYSGKDFYECDMCGVITNNIFTDAAYKTASKLNVILIDKNLLEMLYN